MDKIAVTIPEARAISGIGRSSLYKLFNQGKLTPRKAGKRTLILVTELEHYLKSLPVGGRGNEWAARFAAVGSHLLRRSASELRRMRTYDQAAFVEADLLWRALQPQGSTTRLS